MKAPTESVMRRALLHAAGGRIRCGECHDPERLIRWCAAAPVSVKMLNVCTKTIRRATAHASALPSVGILPERTVLGCRYWRAKRDLQPRVGCEGYSFASYRGGNGLTGANSNSGGPRRSGDQRADRELRKNQARMGGPAVSDLRKIVVRRRCAATPARLRIMQRSR